jgi:hypothetical protein
MSHLVCSQISILDLDILRKAIAGFGGLKWNEGATKFYSYGDTGRTKSEHGTCEHSITVEKADRGFQIGVIKRNDGEGWTLAFDPMDNGVLKTVGGQSSKLMSAYSEAYIRDWSERNGFMVDQSVDKDGNIEMVLTSSS